ncbi:cation diffusion facilitator CzcD-associated flavoprotein CzcO [Humitalea rosea]|uniref:Cation diffusion facilitator CzcD-associated flavoprotein CzcO n=1 Tax=Humitalea rosea TaxID=990373 RepID=A0A2W7IRJ7_9PROT|nr:NAD(P)/FAD-dependent oxidoreductase [Humitalea rosea]PZW48737.1 cation diffusion facilitator CzcD-associated flavoprotein CzcO [Humitalea rosea]
MPARSLVALEAEIARDLDLTAHPRAPWLAAKTCQGEPVLDCLIIGAGQCGIAAAHALKRDRVDNILVIDRAAYGREGPWVTYARMHTLRSWKDQTGPDLKTPSLTYQAWHEAQWGPEHFLALRWIAKEHWNDYLLWFRRVTRLPVRNGITAGQVTPCRTDDDLPCLAIETSAGVLRARKVILATGQEGAGRWWMPEFVEALPKPLRSHAVEDIDFAALRDRTVAVLGAGASAFDNAATALEAGAAEVHLFCRRAEPMVIQPYRWLTFAGFLRHMHEMEDAWRWRFMAKILGLREGFPADTYARVLKFPNFFMHVGRPWTGAREVAGRVELDTTRGPFTADHVICGTGALMDAGAVPMLAGCADNIATWADRYTPPPEEANERIGRFPYLDAGYAFTEKRPGETPWIADIHLFGIGTSLSFGPAGSSINAMGIAVPRLAAAVTRGLFAADLPRLWAELGAYDLKQVELDPSRIAAD